MPTIGTFKRDGDDYTGTLTTLILSGEVRFIANKAKKSDNSPDYFVKAGACDLGVAWKGAPSRKATGRAKAGKEYLRVILDDPALAAPIEAVLLGLDAKASLVWNRPS